MMCRFTGFQFRNNNSSVGQERTIVKNNNFLLSQQFNSAHPGKLDWKTWKLFPCVWVKMAAKQDMSVMRPYLLHVRVRSCATLQGLRLGRARVVRLYQFHASALRRGPESQKNPPVDTARTSRRRTKAANPQHAFPITRQGRLPDSRPIKPYGGTTWMTACLTTTKCQTISKGKQIEKKRCLGWYGIAVNVTCE